MAAEGSCFILKKCDDGLDGVATLELDGKWVFGQCYAGRSFVVLQSRFE